MSIGCPFIRYFQKINERNITYNDAGVTKASDDVNYAETVQNRRGPIAMRCNFCCCDDNFSINIPIGLSNDGLSVKLIGINEEKILSECGQVIFDLLTNILYGKKMCKNQPITRGNAEFPIVALANSQE